ncbi:hypothetical protein AXK58_19345 [Tsukamurella tyrosinosolvens]|nr:hypothetical protein AXK58_19345 [Tsukamurella tyrosinosolvens]
MFPASTVASLLGVTDAEAARLSRDVLSEEAVEALASLNETDDLKALGSAVAACQAAGWSLRDIGDAAGIQRRRVMYAHSKRADQQVHVPGLTRRKQPPPKPGIQSTVGPRDAA